MKNCKSMSIPPDGFEGSAMNHPLEGFCHFGTFRYLLGHASQFGRIKYSRYLIDGEQAGRHHAAIDLLASQLVHYRCGDQSRRYIGKVKATGQ
jgi:hypothetical protein